MERLQRRLAARLLGLGRRVVVEWGTWSRAERDDLREGARLLGAAVELHVVDAPVEVLWERVRARAFEEHHAGRALTRQDLEEYAAVFEAPDDDELALYDPPLHVSRPDARPWTVTLSRTRLPLARRGAPAQDRERGTDDGAGGAGCPRGRTAEDRGAGRGGHAR